MIIALNAINALLNIALNGLKVAWVIDTGEDGSGLPLTNDGIENEFYIPFLAANNGVMAVRSYNNPNDAGDEWSEYLPYNKDHNYRWEFSRGDAVLAHGAVFTPVTVPAAVWLLGSSIIGSPFTGFIDHHHPHPRLQDEILPLVSHNADLMMPAAVAFSGGDHAFDGFIVGRL